MCNVYKSCIPIIFAAALALAACGSDNSDEQAAARELAAADSMISNGAYASALSALDSIEVHYPKNIDVRRHVHDLRPRAIERYTIEQIQRADSLIAATQEEIAGLENEFTHVSGGDLEGYCLHKSYKAQAFTNTTGVQPRVNDADYRFYLVASNNGSKLNIRRLAYVISGKEYISEAIPAGSERSTALEGGELATFLPEEVDSVGKISFESTAPVTEIVLIGDNGRRKVKVSPSQAEGLVKSWRYGNQKNQLRSALILREKLDRQLQTARDQIANRATDDAESQH